eukprot:NODE_16185_length_1008_cov_1.434733.p1 GENE.NODE_16185_length_1008_cov_1.434733~~NODE_16185_length_1008_cov_1.434733.p1  ORF type:complete len:321 (-),score=117.78 NODE_16185_length_1008_cov_1.434733:46-1008(-)
MLHAAVYRKRRSVVLDGESASNAAELVQSAPGHTYGRFDTAVAQYGVQLRAWVDLQVDARLSQVLRDLVGVEFAGARQDCDALRDLVTGELIGARQHVDDAMEATLRVKAEVSSLTESQSRMLVVIQGISEELGRMKEAIADCQELNATTVAAEESQKDRDITSRLTRHDEVLQDMERLHGQHESAVADLQDASGALVETRREVGDLVQVVQELEQRLAEWREAATAEAGLHQSKLSHLEQDLAKAATVYEDLETRVEALRNDVATAASEQDLESRMRDSRQDLRTQIEESNSRLSEDLVAHHQKLISKLRGETNAAFRS